MWDSVPWMVGGGAEHSTNVARNVAFAAFGGREGVVNPTDLEVRELAVLGAGVQVFPGTVAILNRAVGIRDEMYVGRKLAAETVPIAATTAGAGRSDLIIARVENPFLSGEQWNAPTDPKTGPYIFTRVLNVPAGTKSVADLGLGYSAIALARIDIPASTSVITQAMITDLRTLAFSKAAHETSVVAPSATDTLTSANYTKWPAVADLTVTAPAWATHISARAILAQVSFGAKGDNSGAGWNVISQLRMKISATDVGPSSIVNVSNDGGADRATIMVGLPRMAIPKAMRGGSITVSIEGKKNSGNTSLAVDASSILSTDVDFTARPESNG